MPRTYEPIASQTLGSNSATVTFSSIAGSFTDLVLVAVTKMDQAANLYVRFNSDTGSNYSYTYLQGNGSAATSARVSSGTYGWMGISDNNGGHISILSVMNYANTNVHKTALGNHNWIGNQVHRSVQLWRSTSAITSITILCQGAAVLNSGSTFSLYGIKAA